MIPDVWKNHAYRVVFEKDLLHTIASIEIDGLKRTDARGRPKSPEILFQECMEVLRVELSEKDILVIVTPLSDTITIKKGLLDNGYNHIICMADLYF